jgi:hypothetical protein
MSGIVNSTSPWRDRFKARGNHLSVILAMAAAAPLDVF